MTLVERGFRKLAAVLSVAGSAGALWFHCRLRASARLLRFIVPLDATPHRDVKVYCEHGALTPKLRALQRERRIELIYFPYDPDSLTKHISPTAAVSDAQWRDLNVKDWSGLAHVRTWDDFKGSEQLTEIQNIIGPSNRRDALHVDSAYKSGCRVFVTTDGDILNHRERLGVLLGIRFFHPEQDAEALSKFIEYAGGCASSTN
jgi:hypothetical protein